MIFDLSKRCGIKLHNSPEKLIDINEIIFSFCEKKQKIKLHTHTYIKWNQAFSKENISLFFVADITKNTRQSGGGEEAKIYC